MDVDVDVEMRSAYTRTAALIVAAGKGTRMGTQERKQYLQIAGIPILAHTLRAFEQAPQIDEIVLVVGAEDVERCDAYRTTYGLTKLRSVVAGGKERQHSVQIGLRNLSPQTEFVLIHDGVRPFVAVALLARIMTALVDEGKDALVVAVPVKDTIKMAEQPELIISETLPRERLWAIQTPQAFRVSVIKQAHDEASADGYLGTDDAVLAERIGKPVHIVLGDDLNIKITTPSDILLAEAIINIRQGIKS